MDNGTYYSMEGILGPVRLRRHNHDMHDIDGALHKELIILNFVILTLTRCREQELISDDTINFP